MPRCVAPFVAGLLLSCLAPLGVAAETDSKAEPAKYLLRYKFQPGETIRWNVSHRNRTQTTGSADPVSAAGATQTAGSALPPNAALLAGRAAGATQTAETTSVSVKVWRVKEVRPDGTAVFEHLVEDVDMRHQLSGRAEVRYNSRTDKKPPLGYENVAGAVGVPLVVVTLDPLGTVLKRERIAANSAAQSEGEITIPLPKDAMAVGETWSQPHDLNLTAASGRIVKIKTVQKFTLEEVKTGIATIRVATQVLTPIHDPAIESQIVQTASTGTVKFDVDAGRIRSQHMDLDKHVVGFRGGATSVHYVTRFSEDLQVAPLRTASDE